MYRPLEYASRRSASTWFVCGTMKLRWSGRGPDQAPPSNRVLILTWDDRPGIKTFVQAEVGMAIVPRITVAQELRDRALVQIPVEELNMPRRTLMIYREQGYLSQAARELIKIVRNFNWDAKVTPLRAAAAAKRSS